MRFAPCLAVALATVVVGGALLAAPVGAETPRLAQTSPSTTVPLVPTFVTTVPLPTQSTSLTPVTVAPTTSPAINDAQATRLVNRVVAALAGLGVLLALLTFWYWRATRPVPPSLEGVELMSTRKWLRGKPDKRARLLAEYHAKRGPVPDETIARVSAATVRVGAAVAAPAPTPAPSMAAAAPAGRSAPEAAGLHDLTDEPPVVLVGEDDGEPRAEPSEPAAAPPKTTPNGDTEGAFTVVARRPRTEGDADRGLETP